VIAIGAMRLVVDYTLSTEHDFYYYDENMLNMYIEVKQTLIFNNKV